ncbi:Uncharacterised protein [Mycolicibacterium aurum]|uniref:Uncharacterized protein n=1 Tax=Mycolicibacterium aurum TaxID=1791 RepID=A0A3S4S7J6_MYCAU|nr:hypothetical protein [Mycolicibacterium aurum]VEG58185.1 Uncharacterised protein [Mycolicibacterium aurum]
MLPTRSRLERWNPDSLRFTGRAVKDSGRTVAHAVTALSTNVTTMPDTKAWSGDAHTAATTMFDRAAKQTEAFSAYTSALSGVLIAGAGTIGDARTALLDRADQIDMTGQLHVNEQWVVLIAGTRMTLDEAAALEKRAQAEQMTVNGLLLKVGAADDDTADSLAAAAMPYGVDMPGTSDPNDPFRIPTSGSQRPGDEVPNPSNPVGMMQQAVIRDTDMAQTVRDTKTETKYDPATGEEISTTTTIYKQDGSRHVTTVNARPTFSDRGPTTTETHFDKDGDEISETSSFTFNDFGDHGMENANVTTVTFPNGTVTTLIEYPGGGRSATVQVPGRPPADVPLELFDNPALMTGEAAITGLESQAPRGFPMLSDDAAERVRIGAKYGGPALGIATALWDVAVADSGFQRCVATAEGVTSLTTGALAGLATSEMGPWVAITAAIGASEGGTALGNWIGNTFCPR